MEQLNFPNYTFTLKNRENKTYILDLIRKKNLLLTPEEWVRQHCVKFLTNEKKYPKSLINVEKELLINNKKKRYDIVVYKPNGAIQVLIECKAPNINITQNTFDQIAKYNFKLKVNFLVVTNGMQHFCCAMDYENNKINFFESIICFDLLPIGTSCAIATTIEGFSSNTNLK